MRHIHASWFVTAGMVSLTVTCPVNVLSLILLSLRPMALFIDACYLSVFFESFLGWPQALRQLGVLKNRPVSSKVHFS